MAFHREITLPVLPADMRESQKVERVGLPVLVRTGWTGGLG
jgi:hypothetical protein